jgi:hypothetical protein
MFMLCVGFAAAPLQARAQSSIYTGSLHCEATPGGEVPAGNDGITINSRNYRATYTHQMFSAGPAFVGLPDFGRGLLTGNDLVMQGGGSRNGLTLRTDINATNTGRTYIVTATQVFSGRGFRVPAKRACKGVARLVIG